MGWWPEFQMSSLSSLWRNFGNANCVQLLSLSRGKWEWEGWSAKFRNVKKIYTCPSSPLTSLFAARATETATNFGGFTVEMNGQMQFRLRTRGLERLVKQREPSASYVPSFLCPSLLARFVAAKNWGTLYQSTRSLLLLAFFKIPHLPWRWSNSSNIRTSER